MSLYPKSILLSPTKENVTPSKQNDQNIATPNSENITTPKEIIHKNNVWKAPPKIQVDVNDLLQWAKVISNDMQEYELMFNLEEVKQDQKKRTVSVFIVDKCLCKIIMPHKDMVICQLTNLGVKVLARTSYTFWDVLTLTTEEALPTRLWKIKIISFIQSTWGSCGLQFWYMRFLASSEM